MSGKVGLNNRVNYSHNKILQQAHQWEVFRMKKYLGFSLLGPSFTCAKVFNFVEILRGCFCCNSWASLIWRIMMCPHDIEMKDIYIMFSGTIRAMSNKQCFNNTQQIALEHKVKNSNINMNVYDDDDDEWPLKWMAWTLLLETGNNTKGMTTLEE